MKIDSKELVNNIEDLNELKDLRLERVKILIQKGLGHFNVKHYGECKTCLEEAIILINKCSTM